MKAKKTLLLISLCLIAPFLFPTQAKAGDNQLTPIEVVRHYGGDLGAVTLYFYNEGRQVLVETQIQVIETTWWGWKTRVEKTIIFELVGWDALVIHNRVGEYPLVVMRKHPLGYRSEWNKIHIFKAPGYLHFEETNYAGRWQAHFSFADNAYRCQIFESPGCEAHQGRGG